MLGDLISPVRCVACGALADGELCAWCARDVHVLAEPWCGRCGTPRPSAVDGCAACRSLGGFGRARSLVAYAEPARMLTLSLKRKGRRGLARAVGGLVADLARAHELYTGVEVVTFVPGGGRARRAGFDHAQLIARAAAFALGAPMRRLVVRVGDGPRQADVPFARRRTNVGGRFAARASSRHVLLIDDVYTTGATVEACAVALRAAGASSVHVATWARTLRRAD